MRPIERCSKLYLEWYRIRTDFVNCEYNFDIETSLKLLETIPEAVWLLNVLKNENIGDFVDYQLEEMFSKINDPRAKCFQWIFSDGENLQLLKDSADSGYAYAQATYADFTNDLKYAELAMLQNEKNGYYSAALIHWVNIDILKTKEFLRIGIDYFKCLECALFFVETIYDLNDLYFWKSCKLIHKGRSDDVLGYSNFQNLLQNLNIKNLKSNIIYKIGSICKIFNDDNEYYKFYILQQIKYRESIRTWLLCAQRMGVYLDMRIYIGKIIWKLRKI